MISPNVKVILTILFIIAGETSPTKVPPAQPVEGFHNAKRVLALIAKILILRNCKLFIIIHSLNYFATLVCHPFMLNSKCNAINYLIIPLRAASQKLFNL